MSTALDEIARLPGYTALGALRTAVSLSAAALNLQPTLDLTPDQVRADALRMVALTPVLLMRLHRVHQGLAPIDPDPSLGYAAAYLQMLTGERPGPVSYTHLVRILPPQPSVLAVTITLVGAVAAGSAPGQGGDDDAL